MHQNLAFYIAKEVGKYSSDLALWERRIFNARDLKEALKLARFEPPAPPMLRGMSHLTSAARSKASRQIDRLLHQRLQIIDTTEAAGLVALARGMPRYPSVTSWVSETSRRMRSSH